MGEQKVKQQSLQEANTDGVTTTSLQTTFRSCLKLPPSWSHLPMASSLILLWLFCFPRATVHPALILPQHFLAFHYYLIPLTRAAHSNLQCPGVFLLLLC